MADLTPEKYQIYTTILQIFWHLDAFRRPFREFARQHKCPNNKVTEKQQDNHTIPQCIICQLQHIFDQFQYGGENDIFCLINHFHRTIYSLKQCQTNTNSRTNALHQDLKENVLELLQTFGSVICNLHETYHQDNQHLLGSQNCVESSCFICSLQHVIKHKFNNDISVTQNDNVRIKQMPMVYLLRLEDFLLNTSHYLSSVSRCAQNKFSAANNESTICSTEQLLNLASGRAVGNCVYYDTVGEAQFHLKDMVNLNEPQWLVIGLMSNEKMPNLNLSQLHQTLYYIANNINISEMYHNGFEDTPSKLSTISKKKLPKALHCENDMASMYDLQCMISVTLNKAGPSYRSAYESPPLVFITYSYHTHYSFWIATISQTPQKIGQNWSDVLKHCIENNNMPLVLIYTKRKDTNPGTYLNNNMALASVKGKFNKIRKKIPLLKMAHFRSMQSLVPKQFNPPSQDKKPVENSLNHGKISDSRHRKDDNFRANSKTLKGCTSGTNLFFSCSPIPPSHQEHSLETNSSPKLLANFNFESPKLEFKHNFGKMGNEIELPHSHIYETIDGRRQHYTKTNTKYINAPHGYKGGSNSAITLPTKDWIKNKSCTDLKSILKYNNSTHNPTGLRIIKRKEIAGDYDMDYENHDVYLSMDGSMVALNQNSPSALNDCESKQNIHEKNLYGKMKSKSQTKLLDPNNFSNADKLVKNKVQGPHITSSITENIFPYERYCQTLPLPPKKCGKNTNNINHGFANNSKTPAFNDDSKLNHCDNSTDIDDIQKHLQHFQYLKQLYFSSSIEESTNENPINQDNSVTSTTNKPYYFQSENPINKINNNPNKQINRSACFDPNMTLTSLSSSSYEKKYFKSPFIPSIAHDSKNTKILEKSLYVAKSNVCDNEKTRDYRIHLSKSPLQIDRYTPTPPQSNLIYPGMMTPLNSNLALPNIVSNNEIEDRSNSSLFLGPTSNRVAQEIFVEKRDSGYLTNNDQGSTISSDLSSTQSSGPPRRWRQPQQISLSTNNYSANTNLNSRTITNDQCVSDKLYISSTNYFSNDLKSLVIPKYSENHDFTSLPRGNYEALADTSYLYLKNFAIPNTSQIVPVDMKNCVANSRNRIENLKNMNSPSKLITTCAKLPQDPNLTWATNNDAPNSTKYFDMHCPQKSLVPDYPSDQETNSDCDEKCFTLSKETQNLMNQAEIAVNSNDASTALCLYTTAQERARQAMDVHEADPILISQARVLYNKCQLLTRQLSQLFAIQNHTISCNNDEDLHSNTKFTAEPYQNNPLLEKEELIAKDTCSSFDQFSKSLILHRSKEIDMPRSSHLPSVTSFKSSNITSVSSKSIVAISANLNMSTVSIQSFIPSPIKKSMDNTMPSTVINQISSKDTFESVATKRRISERIQKFESKSSLALGIDTTIHKIITPNSQTKSNIQNNQDMIDSTNIYGTIPRSMVKKKGALTKLTKTTTSISNQIISPFKSSFSKINGPIFNSTLCTLNNTHDSFNVSTAQNSYDIRRRSLTHQTVLADIGNLGVLQTNPTKEKTITSSNIIQLSNCRGINSKIPSIPCGVMPKEINDNTLYSVSMMDQSLESSIYNKPLVPNNFYITKECNESIATSPSKTPKKYHFLQELIETSSPPLTSLKNLSPLKKFSENTESFLNNQLLPYTKLEKMVSGEAKMAHKDATIKFNPPNTDGITNRTSAHKNNQWGGLSQTKTSYISYSPCQIDNGTHSQKTSINNISENSYVTFSSTTNNHHQTSLLSHIDITKTKLSVFHKGHSSKPNIGNEINLSNNLIQPPMDIMSQSYHTNNSSSNALKMEVLNKSPNSFTKHSSDHQKKLIFNSSKHIQTLAQTSKDETRLSFGNKNKKSAIPGYENIRCHTPPYQYFVSSCTDEGSKNLLLKNNRKSDIFNTPPPVIIMNNESKKDTDDGNKRHEQTFLALNRPKIWTSGAPKPYTSGMREKLLNTSLNPSTPTSSSKEMMSTHNKLYVRPDSLIFPTPISADLHGNKTKYEDDNSKYGESSNGFTTSTRNNNNNNYNFGKTASNNTYATRIVETFEKMLSPSSCPHPVTTTINSNNLNRTQNLVNGNERKSMTPISIVTCEKCLKIFPSQSPNKSLTNHRRMLCQKCLSTTLSSPTN